MYMYLKFQKNHIHLSFKLSNLNQHMSALCFIHFRRKIYKANDTYIGRECISEVTLDWSSQSYRTLLCFPWLTGSTRLISEQEEFVGVGTWKTILQYHAYMLQIYSLKSETIKFSWLTVYTLSSLLALIQTEFSENGGVRSKDPTVTGPETHISSQHHFTHLR